MTGSTEREISTSAKRGKFSQSQSVTVEFVKTGRFHLFKNSGNFGLVVNGKRFFGSPHWEIAENKDLPKMQSRFPGWNVPNRFCVFRWHVSYFPQYQKFVPFSRLELSEGIFVFHLPVSRFPHQFQDSDEMEQPFLDNRQFFPGHWTIFFRNGKRLKWSLRESRKCHARKRKMNKNAQKCNAKEISLYTSIPISFTR